MNLLLPNLLLLLQSGLLLVRADVHEYRLLKDLMRDYDASSRPVKNSTTALRVVFGMSLHLIIDVDERNQILTTNCWLTQMWNDSHLTWNASDYGGIHVIRIPYQRVWRPDIILYNNADAQYSSSVINTNVIVSDNGEVVWLSHGIFRSSCDINVEYFPFDLQKCKMKWASWTYDGYQIDLQKQTNEGDMSNYQTNGEFDLINFEAIHSVQFYSCCPEPYPDITFVITMKRRPLFYVFNLILPCLLINGIALLVFYVPSESGEKVTLGISALLSMTVFLMTIRESLPPTEKTPLISLYYGVSICLVSFASGLSVVTLNLHHRGLRGTAVPYYLRRIVLDCLARVVFLRFEADPVADLHHQQRSSPTGTNRDNGNQAITRQVESSAASTSTTVTTRSDSSSKSLRRDPRCTCNHPTESINRKRRKPAISVTQSSLSAWHTSSINGLPSASNGRRLRDVERLTSGYVEPDFCDKFQAQDMDYLGIGPPSPIFCTRRVAGIPKPPPPPPQTPPSPPPPPPQPFASEIVGTADIERPVMEGSNVRRVLSQYEEQLALLMARVTTAVECNELRVQDQERREAISLEWKQLALVCDRILLLTFVIVTTVATCVVLTSSPHGP